MNISIEENFDKDKIYNFGCVICAFNRQELVTKTLESINSSFVPDDFLFVFIDDGSDSILNFKTNFNNIVIRKNNNFGIYHSLVFGWDLIYIKKISFMLNIDSDTLVSRNWFSKIFSTYQTYVATNKKECIVTGFNGTNHKVIHENKNYLIKESIGGINLFFHRQKYSLLRKSLVNIVRIPDTFDNVKKNFYFYKKSKPIKSKKLREIIKSKGWNPDTSANGWDWSVVSLCHIANLPMICTKPSVVQHIGSYGINSEDGKFEKSLDFENQGLIPKIIHQTWKNKDIPHHLKIMQESVLEHNKDFQYMFWTDEDMIDFVKNNYKEYWSGFNSFKYIIQQIDFFRLLLLYHYGGVYIDIDTLCLANLSEVTNYPVVLIQTKKHKMFRNHKFVLNNAFMAAEKNNLFIKNCLENALNLDVKKFNYNSRIPEEHLLIYFSAGPLMVTDTYNNLKYKQFIKLFDDHFYHGYYKNDDFNVDDLKNKFQGVYKMVHVHESSWWKTQEGGFKKPDLAKKRPFV